MRIVWLSSYLDKKVANALPRNEVIAMRYAKEPTATTVSYRNVTTAEYHDLDLLRNGRYQSKHKDQDVQSHYDKLILSYGDQVRQEVKRNLMYFVAGWAMVLLFVAFLAYAHHQCSTPGHIEYYENAC
jgi:hypothetical protein